MRTWAGQFWRGEVPLTRAFWEYTIGYGSLLHIATTGLAYGAYVAGTPLWLAALIYFSPLPYTLLATVGVWRSAGFYAGPLQWSRAARICVLIWALGMTLL